MKKTIRYALLLTVREKIALEKIAEAEGGLSQAAVLRRLVRSAALEQGLWPITMKPSHNLLIQEVQNHVDESK